MEVIKEINRLRSVARLGKELYLALETLHKAAWKKGCSAKLSKELLAAKKVLKKWDES